MLHKIYSSFFADTVVTGLEVGNFACSTFFWDRLLKPYRMESPFFAEFVKSPNTTLPIAAAQTSESYSNDEVRVSMPD